MEKYQFSRYSTSAFEVDPVFKIKAFDLCGDPLREENAPMLFEIHLPNKRRFKYCLVNPVEIIKNETVLLQIKRYLIAHEHNEDREKPVNTYFIGDLNKAIEVSLTFSNQTIIHVTYEMVKQWYPKSIDGIFDVIIGFILQHQKFNGQMFRFYDIDDDILFVDSSLSNDEKRVYKQFMLQSMKKEGLIEVIEGGFAADIFMLTSKAISMHQKSAFDISNRDAFVAIKFSDNGDRIGIICDAITEAGFNPIVMNRIETNNWIMPEIFHYIQTSRFVVVDFSLPCDGAYYEAGYATALNKPVIHLFDKKTETKDNKLHFDIAQKSTIFYEDFKDLKIRLVNRIKATIK